MRDGRAPTEARTVHPREPCTFRFSAAAFLFVVGLFGVILAGTLGGSVNPPLSSSAETHPASASLAGSLLQFQSFSATPAPPTCLADAGNSQPHPLPFLSELDAVALRAAGERVDTVGGP